LNSSEAVSTAPAYDVLKLTLPNQMAYLALAQAFVDEAARQFGFTGSGLSEIQLGVEEAVTNVMKHGYDVEESRSFDILCERIAGGMRIVVCEKGIPFDPSQIPDYNPGSDLADSSTAGLGVFLMRAMMDDCSFHNLGPGGKETHLIKYLPPAAPEAGAATEAPPPAAPDAIPRKIEYDVRLMRAEEAIEVSRCAYKSHGYSFFDDHIYYPERLVELNRSGEMISAVAVTRDNTFMGHAALLYQYPEDRIAELTFVFVNQEYRGQGALNRLNDFLLTTPKSREFAGMYAYAVANHPFTQKATQRSGLGDCGILLATSPVSWKFKGIAGDASQRISVVLSFKYMETPQRLTLFPPAQHREMIARLYRELGVEHDYVIPVAAAAPAEPSSIESSANPSEGCAEIFVARYGSDAVREVKKLLRSFCLRQMAAVNLFLNLEDPLTAVLAGEFEKLGFFFAGILPRARVGDTLILQYLNNVDLDYGKIVAYSPSARQTLAYIRERDPNESI
jgi:anti-sigma regulatory factor (Ser/Thr protein kinase)